VVVVGHSALLVVSWPESGTLVVGNLLSSVPALAVLTWLFQVIPLFFIAGGAANALSWSTASQLGVGYPTWLWARLRRLYRPVLAYLAVMCLIATLCTLTLGPASDPLLALACQMLWFLGIYVVTTALLPVMMRIPAAWRVAPFVIGMAWVAAVEWGVQRLGWPAELELGNFIVVWLVVQQLGLSWNASPGSRRWLMAGLSCLGAAALLVIWGPWPVSLVGVPGEEVSNMAPPSLVLLLYGLGIGCLLLWLRPWLARVLCRPRIWTVAAVMSGSAMTVYLWHVPAIGASVTVLHLLGHPPPTFVDSRGIPAPMPDGLYGLWWFVCLALALIVLALLVLVLGRSERRPLRWWDTPTRVGPLPRARASWLVAIGAALMSLGTLALSIVGLAGFPTSVFAWNGVPLSSPAAILIVLAGAALARSASSVCSTPPRRVSTGSNGLMEPTPPSPEVTEQSSS